MLSQSAHRLSYAIVVMAFLSIGVTAVAQCTNTVTSTMRGYVGNPLGSYTTQLVESGENTPECILLTITDVSWLTSANVFIEDPGNQGLSDLAVFVNNGLGQATICFSSDLDPLSQCTPTTTTHEYTVNETATGGATVRLRWIRGFNMVGWGNFTTIVMSDPETSNVFSDSLTLQNPEPSTLLLLGTGLMGVVGVARRKRIH